MWCKTCSVTSPSKKESSKSVTSSNNLSLTGLYVGSLCVAQLFEAGDEEAAAKFIRARINNLTEPGVTKQQLGGSARERRRKRDAIHPWDRIER